jgi:hypothetical protein
MLPLRPDLSGPDKFVKSMVNYIILNELWSYAAAVCQFDLTVYVDSVLRIAENEFCRLPDTIAPERKPLASQNSSSTIM